MYVHEMGQPNLFSKNIYINSMEPYVLHCISPLSIVIESGVGASLVVRHTHVYNKGT